MNFNSLEFNTSNLFLTFSEAVANRVPWELRAKHERAAWWAAISTGDFSVLARSMSCTWPGLRPATIITLKASATRNKL